MFKAINTKMLISGGVILAAAALIIGGTFAFFSDTETSNNNTFTAGSIDLSLGGQFASEANGNSNVVLASDNNGRALYNFTDLKPGDDGYGSFNLNVTSNDAYVCAKSEITSTPENGITDPETTAGDVTGGANDGELQNYLQVATYADLNNDNAYQSGEPVNVNQYGAGDANGFTMAEIAAAGWVPVADPTTPNTWLTIGSLPANTQKNAGMLYCFGNFITTGSGAGTVVTGCDGANGDQNLAQTDQVIGSIQFYAVQTRNNPSFTCASLNQTRPIVGALLSAYIQPTCDVNVSNGGAEPNTIAEGIAAAVNGNKVCVAAGTYNEDVVINKEITLAGATATSVINGQTGGQGAAVTIAANNVTLEGFQINGLGLAALWLNTGVSGAIVQYNKITSASGVTAVTTQGNQSNHMFSNNEFVGAGAGQLVYVNGSASLGQPSSNVDFDNNTFSGTIVAGGVALGNESTGSDITENKFAATLTSTYAIAETWEDDANINFNNFNGVGGIKVKNGDSGTVDAENNWWGAAVPAGHTAGLVDDNPKEASAFPEN